MPSPLMWGAHVNDENGGRRRLALTSYYNVKVEVGYACNVGVDGEGQRYPNGCVWVDGLAFIVPT